MTTLSSTEIASQKRSSLGLFLDRLPGAKYLKNLNIAFRLILGFGTLVTLTVLVIISSYLGSFLATENINRTEDVHVPTTLILVKTQGDLLSLLSDIRGYLALGQKEFRDDYHQNRRDFENDLAELDQMLPAASQDDLDQLKSAFTEWSKLPDELFKLRDDQIEREPAYKLLAIDGAELVGQVLIDINTLIELQGQQTPTPENLQLLEDMAKFQGTFASMFSALRGYTTTRNPIFKQEFEFNLNENQRNWDRLRDKYTLLTSTQQAGFDNIDTNREAFLQMPDQIFEILEGERWREDLYLFSEELLPAAENIETLLAKIIEDQQILLRTDLNTGRTGLARANRQILAGGLITLVLGGLLTYVFYENIAGPVRRLTGVAEQIKGGDLEAQAQVEARDEIGTLAETFNSMTSQLRQTLFQVRREKKRADDLLHVVIPIGVELSSEKDFNRLLEKIVVEAQTFCNANTGVLYLRPAQADHLQYVILRNNAQNITLGGTTKQEVPFQPLPLRDPEGQPNHQHGVTHVALSGDSANITDVSEVEGFDFSLPEADQEKAGYLAATSMLIIPVKDSQDKVLGVMQLLDAQNPETGVVVPFDRNLQQMMESFSSLASAALESYIREQSLRREIHQLRIEIDEAKRQQQVKEIVETDFFAGLQAKAKEIRHRGQRSKQSKSESSESDAG